MLLPQELSSPNEFPISCRLLVRRTEKERPATLFYSYYFIIVNLNAFYNASPGDISCLCWSHCILPLIMTGKTSERITKTKEKAKKYSNSKFCTKYDSNVADCHVAVIFRHSCLSVFSWQRLVLRFLDSKQLLEVSWISWYYFSKWYWVTLECTFIFNNSQYVQQLHSFLKNN